ncbi:MAG: hypothetical protein JNL79_25585 [Myxococcales bacterium]|nr:hypothetical protein [Myxococcales bacterium]
MDPHRLAEERSLALHQAVVRAIREDDTIVDRALSRVRAHRAEGLLAGPWADAWEALLLGPRAALLGALQDPSEAGRALRQTTPFTFVVPPRERWQIWREVARR